MWNVELVHCNECGGERNHTILAKHKAQRDYETSDPHIYVTEYNEYTTLKCGGCESVKLKHVRQFSEEDSPTIRFLPGAMPRRLPEWIWQCHPGAGTELSYIGKLLREIYAATAEGATTVAAMGVRALIEFVMVSKVGDQGTFAENLEAFYTEGFVSKNEQARLARILDIGSAAIHRAFVPSPMDTLTLIEIAEHIIAAIYIHDDAVNAASQNVPARPQRAKKKAQSQKA